MILKYTKYATVITFIYLTIDNSSTTVIYDLTYISKYEYTHARWATAFIIKYKLYKYTNDLITGFFFSLL